MILHDRVRESYLCVGPRQRKVPRRATASAPCSEALSGLTLPYISRMTSSTSHASRLQWTTSTASWSSSLPQHDSPGGGVVAHWMLLYSAYGRLCTPKKKTKK